jgi:hypothetical protein
MITASRHENNARAFVRLGRAFREEMGLHERSQDGGGRSGVYAPQVLDLPLGQLQAGDLDKLVTDKEEQFAQSRIGHTGVFGKRRSRP